MNSKDLKFDTLLHGMYMYVCHYFTCDLQWYTWPA